jgi:hypothetical protein
MQHETTVFDYAQFFVELEDRLRAITPTLRREPRAVRSFTATAEQQPLAASDT